jgi:hypothetical protein
MLLEPLRSAAVIRSIRGIEVLSVEFALGEGVVQWLPLRFAEVALVFAGGQPFF